MDSHASSEVTAHFLPTFLTRVMARTEEENTLINMWRARKSLSWETVLGSILLCLCEPSVAGTSTNFEELFSAPNVVVFRARNAHFEESHECFLRFENENSVLRLYRIEQPEHQTIWAIDGSVPVFFDDDPPTELRLSRDKGGIHLRGVLLTEHRDLEVPVTRFLTCFGCTPDAYGSEFQLDHGLVRMLSKDSGQLVLFDDEFVELARFPDRYLQEAAAAWFDCMSIEAIEE